MESSFQVQGRHMRFAGIPHQPPNESSLLQFDLGDVDDDFLFTVSKIKKCFLMKH